jgi:hypothetical protein
MNALVGSLACNVLYGMDNEETKKSRKAGIRHSKCKEQGGDGGRESGRWTTGNVIKV